MNWLLTPLSSILVLMLILILVYRPTGIMGSRELRWPRRRGQAELAGPAEPET